MKRNGKRLHVVTPVFVDEIPLSPEHGKLYLSFPYRAMIHLCACGCGAKISTPLHPTMWQVQFDGKTVTLHPSVGNWSERCQSHYIIRNNRVLWAEGYSQEKIRQTRKKQKCDLAEYYETKEGKETPPSTIWTKLRKLFIRR